MSRLERDEFAAVANEINSAGGRGGKTMTGQDATRWMAAQGD